MVNLANSTTMYLQILITFLLLQLVIVTNTQNCPNISMYEKMKDENMRLTSINDGDIIIHALGTFTSLNSKCGNVSIEGLRRYFALKYAIDKVNSNSDFTRLGKLGLQIDDVCTSLPITMARGIEIISLHRPNSVCRADFLRCDLKETDSVTVKKATAVIGTGMSFTTIPLASLMSLYSIPQVSYSASSRLLSKNELYKSFFRTIPSDKNQINVMIAMFRKFKWNFIFAVGTDDDYGKLGINDLKQATTSSNQDASSLICITKDEYIPYNSVEKTDAKIAEVVEKIDKDPQAKVVVLFTYIDIGRKILKLAQKRNISRIWLTSEAWNPPALSLPSELREQAVGTLTVSIKINQLDYLKQYMRREIKENWNCNMWLKNYLRTTLNCYPTSFDKDTEIFYGDNNCTVSFANLQNILGESTGRLDSTIDSINTVAHAIRLLTKKHCNSTGDKCTYRPTPKDITNIMVNVSFINEQDKEVSFDEKGDPKYADYTIENLQFNETSEKYEYIQVGQWNSKRVGNELQLNESKIKWPSWHRDVSTVPTSVCSDTCKPGTHLTGRSGCCWVCQECPENQVTRKEGQENCTVCDADYHANSDHSDCVKTPQLWLRVEDSSGLVIIIISSVGLALIAASAFVILKYWDLVKLGERAAYVNMMSLVLIFLTFAYGPLHILKPTDFICRFQNSAFFLLLMLFAALLLVKSKFITKMLSRYSVEKFGGRFVFTQLLFVFGIMFIQLVTVLVWVYYDNVGHEPIKQKKNTEILLQCKVDFTAARLIATFLPCVVLIIATSCAFRERNIEHAFYEPKFLSFTCIALCIIMLAFLPTFKYVIGEYRAIVMAFTIDVFAFTYMVCMILPKVYVGIVRNIKGKDTFPLKVSATTVKRSKKKDKVDKSRAISAGDMTETSAIETSGKPSPSIEQMKEIKEDFGTDDDIHFTCDSERKIKQQTPSQAAYDNSVYDESMKTSNGTTGVMLDDSTADHSKI